MNHKKSINGAVRLLLALAYVVCAVSVSGLIVRADENDSSFSKYFDVPVLVMVGDRPLNTSAGQMYPSPAVYDVDSDGQVELVVGDIFGSLNVYENQNDSGKGDPVWSQHVPLKSADGEPVKVSNW